MNALTVEDYEVAVVCCRQRAYDARRTLEVMGAFCDADYRQDLLDRARAEDARTERFSKALWAAMRAERRQ